MQIETEWLTRAEVAQRLRLSSKTLANWATTGRGPKFKRFGNRCRYRVSDVVAWENKP
ncbi:helix-turn-helix transcriptional regulator [Nocardia goodfellowii]